MADSYGPTRHLTNKSGSLVTRQRADGARGASDSAVTGGRELRAAPRLRAAAACSLLTAWVWDGVSPGALQDCVVVQSVAPLVRHLHWFPVIYLQLVTVCWEVGLSKYPGLP